MPQKNLLNRNFIGIFEIFLHANKERDRLFSIDNAMVVAEREIHHGTNDNLVIYYNGALDDLVHAQDPALRRVEDRRGEEGAIDATVSDGECTVL